MPVAWASAFQSAQWAATKSTRGSVGFVHAEKTRVQLCKSSGCQAQGRVSFCMRACVRARTHCREFTKRKHAISFILCFSSEVLSSNLTPLLYPTIFRENKRAVPDYVLHKSAEMTFNKPLILSIYSTWD